MTTLFVDEGDGNMAAVLDAVHAFMDDIKSGIPSPVFLSVENTVDFLNEQTGQLTGEYSDSVARPALQGGSVVQYAAGVGSMLTWHTGAFIAGRRLRGRTFIAPIGVDKMQSDGTILNSWRDQCQAAADTLLTSLNAAGKPLQVWHRPVNGSGGSVAQVQAGTMADKISWLYSRRT